MSEIVSKMASNWMQIYKRKLAVYKNITLLAAPLMYMISGHETKRPRNSPKWFGFRVSEASNADREQTWLNWVLGYVRYVLTCRDLVCYWEKVVLCRGAGLRVILWVRRAYNYVHGALVLYGERECYWLVCRRLNPGGTILYPYYTIHPPAL